MSWKKKLVSLGLTLTLVAPVSVFAAGTTPSLVDGNGKAPSVQGGEPLQAQGKIIQFFKSAWHHVTAAGVHREEYFRLLAEKYTPQDVSKWEAAFAERRELNAQLKSLKENGTLQEKWGMKKDEMKAKAKEIRDKVKNGELTKEEAKEQIKQWVEEKKGEISPIFTAHKELHQSFTEAIAKQDEDAIRTLLPQLLTEMEKENQFLADKIAELKAGTTP